ncbi:hypothetical protein ABZ348_20270 [Streptomyces sp. NPDC005963]|uniref:hypothetical protein n=1 Tax=Streptomyces sp. NPDC005963 TaxID=3156721 RepID=UPI0033FB2DF8
MPITASVRPRTGAAVAVALAAGLALADAPAAFAAPGDSGDLTVLSASSSRGNVQREDSVCKFKIVADNFENLTAIAWTITSRPPTTPQSDTLSGSLPLDEGRARSDEYRLPDGTYQLQWTVPSGVTKLKTFVVHCEEGSTSGGANTNGNPPNGANGSTASNGTSGSNDSNGTSGSNDSSASETYEKPSGPVPAGGGGVPTMESTASSSSSPTGTTTALVAGAAGIAGLLLARRAARRRSRGEA